MTIQQWNTKSLGTDYRLGPRETKLETCTFRLPDGVALGELEGHGRPQLPEAGQAGRRLPRRPGRTRPRSSRSTGIRRRSRSSMTALRKESHDHEEHPPHRLRRRPARGGLPRQPPGHARLRPQVQHVLQDLPRALPQAQALRRGVRRERLRHQGQGHAALHHRHRRRGPVPPPRAPHRPAPRGLPGLQQRQRPPGRISSRPTSSSSSRAARITKNIAYYFYFFFSERGEVAGIEDAFVMFNDLFGSDLDLYRRPVPDLRPALQAGGPPALRGLPDLPGDAGRLPAST
ncbi:MAG: hypothetical protein MZV64_13105 [Ignavibacteriales bacterium]|nr:hypothetical protein [Ignavibacteriales bacterium]